jgi:Kef-type K+ transport system membrane component KefB
VSDNFDDTMDGAASIALAIYLIAVVYRGNLFPFLNELKKEIGFLEFVVAIYIIYRLMKIPSLSGIVGMFVVGAVLAALLRGSQNFSASDFNDFATGKISIFSLALKLTKGN